MGKRRRKEKLKARKNDKQFSNLDSFDTEFTYIASKQNVKNRSKIDKKMRRKMQKMEERQKPGDRHNGEGKDQFGYHKVSVFVKDSMKIDKNFLLTSIGNYVDQTFCPLGYLKVAESITFYFDANKDVADAIRSLDKRIPSPSGELMGIKVSFVKDIESILNCDQIEILKNAVIQRFNPSGCLLDLSCLHSDPVLIENNIFAPLSNEKILRIVFTLIKETMSGISALDLSNNKLTNSSLKLMDILDSVCNSLSAINLEKNNLKDVNCLKYLRSFPLKELKLIGNTFNGKISPSSQKYIKNVKRELPFLKMIDNQDISEMSSKMMKPSSSVVGTSALTLENTNTAVIELSSVTEEKLKTFLEQYYSLIDTPEKGMLLQAYIPSAKIVLKSENPVIPNKIFEGQQQIQEFLESWPGSKHDHSSFNLEVLNISPQEGLTRVQGACLFPESQMTIQFNRTMKIIPFNSGLCCLEDLLEIH